jgi:hypothetical protein
MKTIVRAPFAKGSKPGARNTSVVARVESHADSVEGVDNAAYHRLAEDIARLQKLAKTQRVGISTSVGDETAFSKNRHGEPLENLEDAPLERLTLLLKRLDSGGRADTARFYPSREVVDWTPYLNKRLRLLFEDGFVERHTVLQILKDLDHLDAPTAKAVQQVNAATVHTVKGRKLFFETSMWMVDVRTPDGKVRTYQSRPYTDFHLTYNVVSTPLNQLMPKVLEEDKVKPEDILRITLIHTHAGNQPIHEGDKSASLRFAGEAFPNSGIVTKYPLRSLVIPYDPERGTEPIVFCFTSEVKKFDFFG